MSTATTTKAKEIPAQANVTIVGGKTRVALRAYGVQTCDRAACLLAELMQNASTHPVISEKSKAAAKAMTDLVEALNDE